MSIIQYIRDKASWLIIVLIVLSLVGFILMDASVSRNSFFSNSNEVGRVGSYSITYPEYQAIVQTMENNYTQQLGGAKLNDEDKATIQENAWSSVLESKVMSDIYANLGITFHKNELRAILAGNIILDIFRSIPAFNDPVTNTTDPEKVKQYVTSITQSAKTNPEAKASFEKFIEEIKQAALKQKYIANFIGTENDPKWLTKYYDELSALSIKANAISIPYYQLGIDKIEPSEKDIDAYMAKYEYFEKPQETRKIDYVVFDGSPTQKDSMDLFAAFDNVKIAFASAKNPTELISQIDANVSYSPDYYSFDKDIQQLYPENAKEIMMMSVGQTYGGFIDAPFNQGTVKNYNMVRMMKQKTIPQEVELRHILVATNQGRTEEQAKKIIDSIAQAIRAGANFEALAATSSDDGGSNKNGGYYKFNYQKDFLNLDSTFGKTVFYGESSTKKVIKTNFGYHYVEILSQKDPKKGYCIAAITKKIEPSVETETHVFSKATQFSILAKTKGFAEAAKAQQLEISTSGMMKANSPSLLAVVQYAIDVQKWAFREKEIGTISAPIKVKNYYVIAKLNSIEDKTSTLKQQLSERLASHIKQKKIVEKLKDSLAKSQSSFEGLANKYAVPIMQIQASAADFVARDSATSLQSPELVGLLFNPHQKERPWSYPIKGVSSVYLINNKLEKSASTTPNTYAAYFRQMRMRNTVEQNIIKSYIHSLSIEDKRQRF